MTDAVKKIMIVEDDPDTAEMFGEMMQLSGFEVIKSYSGKSAIQEINDIKPDAVVLDVMMPDLSGLEVLRILRKNPVWEHLPVIVVSAKGLPLDIRMGLDSGASMYLTKPVTFQALKTAVSKAIGLIPGTDESLDLNGESN